MAAISFRSLPGDDYEYITHGSCQLVMMASNHYVNATNLCQQAGKTLDTWLRLALAQELIQEAKQHHLHRELIRVVSSGPRLTRGVYLHYHLIPHVMSWAAPKLAFQVAEMISYRQIQSYVTKLKQKEMENQQLQTKLAAIVSRPSSGPDHESVHFVLIHKHDHSKFPYLVIQRHKKTMDRHIEHLKTTSSSLQVLLRLEDATRNMYLKMKETLPIQTRYNSFNTDLSEMELVRNILLLSQTDNSV